MSLNVEDFNVAISQAQKEVEKLINSLSHTDKCKFDSLINGRDLTNMENLDEISKELEILKAK